MKPPIFNPEWPEDVQAVYQHDMQEIWDPNIARHIWNQYHNQLELYLTLADNLHNAEILDIGCAQGTLALMLAERGHDVVAMDIRQQFLDYAAMRYESGKVRFVCGNAMEVDLDRRFDLIFANQIVEHLIYPLEFTRRAVGWLKPGGRLVMTTPNGEYIKNSLPSYSELGDPEQYAHRQFTADGDGHFFAYRSEELKAIFEQAGLREIKTYCFETPFISGHLKVRHIHPLLPRRLLKLFDRSALLIPRLGVRLSHQLMVMGSLAQ
jgi:2-polyprenyl-3-methyl-5-hydroxy-6-metoxy-1,4-benzoquinol methylase